MPNPPNLAGLIARHAPADGFHPTALSALRLVRASTTLEPTFVVQEPALCVIVQGAKRVRLNEEAYVYDVDRYLMVNVDLPLAAEILDATPARPYLAFALRLDFRTVAELAVGAGHAATVPDGRGLAVSALDEGLRGALERYVGLLDAPEHASALAPLYEREVLYRLLAGPEGGRLRALVERSGSVGRIARAVETLRRDFARPLRVEALAREVGMSPSGLHHHFKAATAMSPIQFQKQLRLQEARRLMLGERTDAADAAFRVGYESPSQFSREYKRLFGVPPGQDAARLRTEARSLTSIESV